MNDRKQLPHAPRPPHQERPNPKQSGTRDIVRPEQEVRDAHITNALRLLSSYLAAQPELHPVALELFRALGIEPSPHALEARLFVRPIPREEPVSTHPPANVHELDFEDLADTRQERVG